MLYRAKACDILGSMKIDDEVFYVFRMNWRFDYEVLTHIFARPSDSLIIHRNSLSIGSTYSLQDVILIVRRNSSLIYECE